MYISEFRTWLWMHRQVPGLLCFRKLCQNAVETLAIAFKSRDCSGTNIYPTSRSGNSTHIWTNNNGEPCWKGQIVDTATGTTGSSPKLIWWAGQPIRGISLTDGLCHRFYALHWSKKCRERPTKAARCPSFRATYGQIVWFAVTISETTITCPYLPKQNQVNFVMWQN